MIIRLDIITKTLHHVTLFPQFKCEIAFQTNFQLIRDHLLKKYFSKAHIWNVTIKLLIHQIIKIYSIKSMVPLPVWQIELEIYMKFIRKTVNPTQSISLQMIVNIQILLKAKSIKLHSQIIKKQYYNKNQPIIALIFKIMMIIIIIANILFLLILLL